jgi:prepilin-type N-terminal cleavage/methylation domain-containing protein
MVAVTRSHLAAGFTLIELVISLSIMVLLIFVGAQALTGLVDSKELLDDERTVTTTAGALLSRLTREFQQAERQGSVARIPPPYARGVATTQEMYLESSPNVQGGALDRFTFYANNAAQYVPGSQVQEGTVQISYRAERDPENRDRYLLIRDQVAVPPQDPANAYAQIMTFPLAKNIASFDVMILAQGANGNRWVETYGTPGSAAANPVAIKLSLTLIAPSGKNFTYATIIALP